MSRDATLSKDFALTSSHSANPTSGKRVKWQHSAQEIPASPTTSSSSNSSRARARSPLPNIASLSRRFSNQEKKSAGRRAEAVTAAYSIPRTAPFRSKKVMASMLDMDRSHPRRERTFAGGECVVCEEPLEHTLRGERILQLSCAHVSHEACFYEYIRESDSQMCPSCSAPLGLDSNRGGNVLDIEKLSSIVRSLVVNDTRRSNQASENQYEQQQSQQPQPQLQQTPQQTPPQAFPPPPQQQPYDYETDPYARPRQDSNTTGGSNMSQSMPGRKNEYDARSLDGEGVSVRSNRSKNPIPAPSILIRSEYPTLTRSKQQQTLTCLVTIEIPEGKWQPDMADLRTMRPRLSQQVERAHRHNSSTVSNKPNGIARPPQELAEPSEELQRVTEDLHSRVDNWHGLDFSRFGRLLLHDTVKVGKDRQSWQELECYLFAEMLICVKEKRSAQPQQYDGSDPRPRCVLKGSIMIKKHLNQIETSTDASNILTLNLSVPELPTFHLFFRTTRHLEIWRDAFIALNNNDVEKMSEYDQEEEMSVLGDGDEFERVRNSSSVDSAYAPGSYQTPATEYSDPRLGSSGQPMPVSLHVPVDIVLVIPVSSSMHSLKITLLRDLLRFMIQSLGGRDRMGLVTFGSSGGSVPLVGMTNKAWPGWRKVIDAIKSTGHKSSRIDPVDGASTAMDLLMQRKGSNLLSSILVISDSSASDTESIDFVVSRAEAAKVSIYTFGLGLTHKPDTMIELSTRTKAAYTYVKDWMMIRECVAGCIGSLQSICHQNVVLKLKLPEGSPARFTKISGALQITKKASGRDAEAALGDFRFGERRDVLVQLAITPDVPSPEHQAADPWEKVVSDLEALGSSSDPEDSRGDSIEEVPIIQASLVYGDILRDGVQANSPRPSLLTISMLPASSPKGKQMTSIRSAPPIPPHPSVVQRRMELLTSDMLTRALTLVARGQHERAHALLSETRSILKGLGKGGLPPVPRDGKSTGTQSAGAPSTAGTSPPASEIANERRAPSPMPAASPAPTSGIDHVTMSALDGELETSLEWINHPAVFGRDSRKGVLEKIGIISSQRAYTSRTPLESIYAMRVPGIRAVLDESKNWPEAVNEALQEE